VKKVKSKRILSVIFGLCIPCIGFIQVNGENGFISYDSELYETSRIMEEVEFQYTKNYIDRAILQEQYATERLLELEEALNKGDEEIANILLEELIQHSFLAEENIILATDEGLDTTAVEETFLDNLQKRQGKLEELAMVNSLSDAFSSRLNESIASLQSIIENFDEPVPAETPVSNTPINHGSEHKEKVGSTEEKGVQVTEETKDNEKKDDENKQTKDKKKKDDGEEQADEKGNKDGDDSSTVNEPDNKDEENEEEPEAEPTIPDEENNEENIVPEEEPTEPTESEQEEKANDQQSLAF
jgi:hypothetical protein